MSTQTSLCRHAPYQRNELVKPRAAAAHEVYRPRISELWTALGDVALTIVNP